jgi:hypothetical protein
VNRVSPAGPIIDETATALAANKLNDFLATINFERAVKPIVRVPRIEICFHQRILLMQLLRQAKIIAHEA